MTYSLSLENGDLAKGVRNSLSTVRGAEKVAQDLQCWLLAPYGSDLLQPSYGSFIEYPEGSTVNVAGSAIALPSEVVSIVTSEVNRIVTAYQTIQRVRLEAEAATFGRHTFSDDEIVADFNVETQQLLDTLYVNITLTMISGDQAIVGLNLASANGGST